MGVVAVILVFTGVLAVLGVWRVITRCNHERDWGTTREADGCLPLLAAACLLALSWLAVGGGWLCSASCTIRSDCTVV